MAAEAGYLPDKAHHVTVEELQIAIEARFNLTINDMRNARTIAYVIAASSRDSSKSFPNIEQFMPLPGDAATLKNAALRGRELLEHTRKQRIKRKAIEKLNGTIRT